MGKYANPGTCEPQDYVFRFPINPTVATTKVESPFVGAIGLLLNGIPIYGLTNASSWTGTTNSNQGQDVWNVEVYLAEGFVLDTAFGAHPQQEGAYHSHATPFRLYKNTPTSQHSPIVGFAFDGYPVYGPYGYSTAMSSSSAIARMKSGYALRNITTRTTLPDGSTASQAGPPVNATYPLGTYVEDYAWSSSNGGDLDEYNGRFCVTPEYPSGTYAYFVTIDASGTPEFPYYIGPEYYGSPVTDDITTGITPRFPTSGTSCQPGTGISETTSDSFLKVYPNPNNGFFNIAVDNASGDISQLTIYNVTGEKVHSILVSEGSNTISAELGLPSGLYLIQATDRNGFVTAIEKIAVQ
jgi:hypothetical protein